MRGVDVMMPGWTGGPVLAELKADPALRDVPVIMLTMVDDPERGFTLGGRRGHAPRLRGARR